MDSNFYHDNPDELKEVLKNLKDIDTEYLQILLYIRILEDEKSNKTTIYSGLHRSTKNEDSGQIMNLLLQYQAEIKYQSSVNFKDIFPKLIEQPGFFAYFNSLMI